MALTGGMGVIYDQVPNEFQPASSVVTSDEYFAAFGLNSNGYETEKSGSEGAGFGGGSVGGFAESAASANDYLDRAFEDSGSR